MRRSAAVAARHGRQRWQLGWSITEVVRDYQALQVIVLEFAERSLGRALEVREMVQVGCCIDAAIEESVEAYVDCSSEELAQLIAETVERLVRQIVESAPIDGDWLRAQAETAAAMVAEADKARTLWVNPADAALLMDAPIALPIEADPSLHDQRVEAERRRRYVGLSRVDELGMRALIARLEAGDAETVHATVTRVAELIEDRHPDTSADELRAIAFGYLGRPLELMLLLGVPLPDKVPDLRPRAVLYVHLHEAALHGADSVARVEGLGPMSLAQLQRLLGRRRLTIRPVVDLNDRVRCTAYEHPESLKERVHLVTGGDYWPYAVSTSRRVDYDHPTPYHSDTGPPGKPGRPQTGTHNSGPLGRRHHRWKTHAGYRSRQAGDGRYAWLTPHGLGFLVDHRGTRPIPRAHAEMIIDAPPGLDLYPSDIGIELGPTSAESMRETVGR